MNDLEMLNTYTDKYPFLIARKQILYIAKFY